MTFFWHCFNADIYLIVAYEAEKISKGSLWHLLSEKLGHLGYQNNWSTFESSWPDADSLGT